MERVGIYNRCSTEEESQRNALLSQAAESREIAEKKGWKITEQYIESQTGTVAYKRGEYQRLLEDMEKGKFDIVMIKSIDRLTRSARDWYFFLSRLTENRLKLYIYIEGKYYTPDDNLISGIKAILAEDFSRELSKKIKNAHKRRQEKKSGCNITCEMFGWDKKARNTYVLNEREADYYRMAFDLAKEGKGFYTISNILYELGARGKNGQKISQVQWRKMLYTQRASGTMVLNTRSYNFDTKKYESVSEENWIIMENALPPIVSKEYQEEVLAVLRKRAGKGKAYDASEAAEGGEKQKILKKERGILPKGEGRYDLSRKLICASCGRPYYRTVSGAGAEKKVVWKCATFLSEGRAGQVGSFKGCSNINLWEEELLKGLEEALLKQWAFLFEDSELLLEDFLRLVKKVLKGKKEDEELKRLEKEYKKLADKKKVLIEKLLSGVIGDADFKICEKGISDKMALLETQINSIKSECRQYNNYEVRLKELKEVIIRDNLILKAKLKELIRRIAHISVHEDGRLEILLAHEEPEKTKEGDRAEEKCKEQENEHRLEARYVHESSYQKQRKIHKKEIVRMMKEQPSVLIKDISDQLGMSVSYVSARIRELKEEGAVTYKKTGSTGTWKVNDHMEGAR